MAEFNDFAPLDFKKEGIVLDYKTAGVDIDAGNEFAKSIPITNHGFGGMFKVPRGYEEPILVSGTDGVGTKIHIAHALDDYTTIGIDLVAMCVNDIITSGAKPLYFLDYISTEKICYRLPQIIEGIVKGCEIAGIELIGGETAEHPRFQNSIDLAGFCTGIVEKSEIVDGKLIKPGDQVIGIESSGPHSNGYSLINYLIERLKIVSRDHPELLTPTIIYSPLIENLLKDFPILGMSHITGGGILENLPRCLPEGLDVKVDYTSWERPEIFNLIQHEGNVDEEEMKRVFNLGIGYCLVVPSEYVTDIQLRIFGHGLKSWTIGEVVLK